MPAQGGEHFGSFLKGQHTIQQDHVVDILFSIIKSIFSVVAAVYIIPLSGELPGQGFIQIPVVFRQ